MILGRYKMKISDMSPVYRAVQVSQMNINHIASWCGGVVVETTHPHDKEEPVELQLNVPIHPALGEAKRAVNGDWVVRTPRQPDQPFAVFKDNQFQGLFEPTKKK